MVALDFNRRATAWDASNLTLKIADPGLLLAFRGAYTPATGANVRLNFGAGPEIDLSPREVQLATEMPAPLAEVAITQAVGVSMAATLPVPTVSVDAIYDINVFRGPTGLAAADWVEAERNHVVDVSDWQSGAREHAITANGWAESQRVDSAVEGDITSLPRLAESSGFVWDVLKKRLGNVTQDAFVYIPRADAIRQLLWEAAAARRGSTADSYTHPPRRDKRTGLVYEEAAWVAEGFLSRASEAKWMAPPWTLPWENARQPAPGESVFPGDPEPPVIEPFVGSTNLVFHCPLLHAPWILNFSDTPCGAGIIVPIKKVYVVINNASITRVSDGAAIPASRVGLSIDRDSWAWELQATLAGSDALDLVKSGNGSPVAVAVNINGKSWQVLIDGWGHSRSFGDRNITVRGRSLAAYLAAPYAVPRAYTETQQRTAQQLALQELPAGWTLNWQITDWLVPAGVWSYDRRTPVEAITAIAQAAGAYIQADMSAQSISVLPGYPTAPWDWDTATPDVTLPADVVTQLGTDWQPKNDANVIHVSGREQGVTVQVRRLGSAGNLALPAIIDPLVTEVDAARQRGINELGGTGLQSRESLALPLDNAIAGLLANGQLIEFTGDGAPWRGLVRGVDVKAEVGSGGALSVSQQVAVERHYEVA